MLRRLLIAQFSIAMFSNMHPPPPPHPSVFQPRRTSVRFLWMTLEQILNWIIERTWRQLNGAIIRFRRETGIKVRKRGMCLCNPRIRIILRTNHFILQRVTPPASNLFSHPSVLTITVTRLLLHRGRSSSSRITVLPLLLEDHHLPLLFFNSLHRASLVSFGV